MARGSHRRGPRPRRTRKERSRGGYLPDYFGPGARRRGTAPEPYPGVGEHSSGRGTRRPRPVIPDWARGHGAGHSPDPHSGHFPDPRSGRSPDPRSGRSPGARNKDRRRFLVGDILAGLAGAALFVVILAAVLAGLWLVARAVSSAPPVDGPAPDGDQVRWQVRVAGVGSTTSVLDAQGVAIADEGSALGPDLRAGEQRGLRSHVGDLLVVADQWVNTTSTSIEVLDVA